MISFLILSICFFDVARNNSSFLFAIIICGFFQEVDNLFSGALKGFEKFNVSCFFEVITRVLWASIVIYGIYGNALLYFTCLAFTIKGMLKY
ncbi:flippase, partial [Escherichia coli]|nr:flippase [Escherichia coli]